jgi:hypothetical protein
MHQVQLSITNFNLLELGEYMLDDELIIRSKRVANFTLH